MKKTLLSKKNIGIVLLVLVLAVAGGHLIFNKISEANQEAQRAEAEAQKARIYSQLEWIYSNYKFADEEDTIRQEFDKFLETKFGEENTHILESFEEQNEQNSKAFREYEGEVEKIKEDLISGQISTEEFDKKQSELWEKRKEKEKSLQVFFTEEERKIFEASAKEIEILYRLI